MSFNRMSSNNNSKNRKSNFSNTPNHPNYSKQSSNNVPQAFIPNFLPINGNFQAFPQFFIPLINTNNTNTDPPVYEFPDYSKPLHEKQPSSTTASNGNSHNVSNMIPLSSSMNIQPTQFQDNKVQSKNTGFHDPPGQQNTFTKGITQPSNFPIVQTSNSENVGSSKNENAITHTKNRIELEESKVPVVNPNKIIVESQKIETEHKEVENSMHKHQIEKEDQDLEVLHKKRKSESIMSEKLNTLSNEVTKIKEREVQLLKLLLTSPPLTVNSLEGTKKFKELISQAKLNGLTPSLPSNYLIQHLLSSIPTETLKYILGDTQAEKVRDQAEIDIMRKLLVQQTREPEENLQIEKQKIGPINDEKDITDIKVLHTSMQPFYQENPKIKELEDKMDRLEYFLRDKKSKLREAEKAAGESKHAMDIAKLGEELATQRISKMGLLN